MAVMDDAIATVRFKLSEFGQAAITDEDVAKALWRAYKQFCRDTDAMFSPIYTTSVPESKPKEYDLKDFTAGTRTAERIYRITYLTYDGNVLHYAPPRIAAEAQIYTSDETGIPSWYIQTGRKTIQLYPAPQESGKTLAIRGYEVPDESLDEFAAAIPSYYIDAVEDYAAFWVGSRMLSADDAIQQRLQLLMSRYQSQVNMARREFRLSPETRYISMQGLFLSNTGTDWEIS